MFFIYFAESTSDSWPLPGYLTVLNELSLSILPYRQYHGSFGLKIPGQVEEEDDEDDQEDEEMTEPGSYFFACLAHLTRFEAQNVSGWVQTLKQQHLNFKNKSLK